MKHMRQNFLTALIFALAFIAGGALGSLAMDAVTPARAIVTQARSIVLPEFKLDSVPFMEAVRQLSAISKEHDPGHKGFNYIVTNSNETNVYPNITLNLKNISLADATEQLAKSAGMNLFPEDYAFVFSPRSFVPIHTSLFLAIDHPDRGEYRVDARLKGKTSFDPTTSGTYNCSMRNLDGEECSASIQYRGTANGKDFYLASVSAPPGAVGVPAPLEIAYEGRDIELWKDSKWLVRIGPKPARKPPEP